MIKSAFKSKDLFMQGIYMAITGVMVALVMLVNWVDASFSFERLLDSEYWFQYSITLIVALIGFFLTTEGQIMKLKSTNEIKDLVEQISVYFDYISRNDGLYNRLKGWLIEENDKKKLKMYVISLKKKREKAKKTADIELIDKKIENAKEYVEYADVDYVPKTVNLLFSGFSTKDDDELLVIKKYERLGEYLIPAILLSLIFTVIMLTFVLTPATSTIDKIVQLVARLFCIGSYIYKAFGYSRFYVLERYKATLEQRKAVITSFFDEIGEHVEIENNPCYKYRVKESEKSV